MVDEFGVVARQQQFQARLGGDAFQRLRRGQHDLAHRHRFEHLVLHAAGDAQGRHGQRRAGQVGPDVGHLARHHHAGHPGQRRHGGHGRAADDIELQLGKLAPQRGPDVAHEPLHGVDVGPVIHGACKHQRLHAGRIDCALRRHGREIRRVDAVIEKSRLAPRHRRALAEQGRFGGRNEAGGRELLGDMALVLQQQLRFAPVQQRQGPGLAVAVLAPFVGIDVDEIDHAVQGAARAAVDVLRHGPGKGQRVAHLAARHQAIDPLQQTCIAVVLHAHGLPRQQRLQGAPAGRAAPQFNEARAGTQGGHGFRVLPVVVIVDETAQVHAEMPAQVLQHVPRAYLVALVGRIRQTVGEE